MKRRIFAWVLLAGFVLLILNLIVFRFYWQVSMVAYLVIVFAFILTNGKLVRTQEIDEDDGTDSNGGSDSSETSHNAGSTGSLGSSGSVTSTGNTGNTGNADRSDSADKNIEKK